MTISQSGAEHGRQEIHPQDALREKIDDGARVAVESTWGAITVEARHSRRVPPGTLFLPCHFPQTHTNRLVGRR